MSDNNEIMPTEERVQALNNLRGDFSKEELIRSLMVNSYKTDSLLNALDAIALSVDHHQFGLPGDIGSRSRMREVVLKWLLEVI